MMAANRNRLILALIVVAMVAIYLLVPLAGRA